MFGKWFCFHKRIIFGLLTLYRCSFQIAAFIAEPVMGAGGVIPPPATYFDKVSCLYHEMLGKCQSQSPVWFQKVVYSLFIFSFPCSNPEIEYRKDPFSHLRVFGKLFWIHNLGIKYIIHRFDIVFYLKKKLLFSFIHTSIRWGPLYFTIFTKLPLYSFSMKMNTMKKCFHFLYSNPTFWILKMNTEYKFLNKTSFFCGGSHWKLKMKTKNTIFPNQTASKYQTGDWHLPSIWNKVLKLNALAPNNINAFAKEFYQYI